MRAIGGTSVLRHAGIDFVGPGNNSARQIRQIARVAGALQGLNRAGAAATHLAMHDRVAARIDLRHALQNLRQRNVN